MTKLQKILVTLASPKLLPLGCERKKASFFALHCTRFSVTLTSSKLLSLSLARKKASLFCTQCTRFSVTLHTYEKRLNSHSTP